MSEEKRETKQALLGELESIKDLLSEDEWDEIPVLSDTVSEPVAPTSQESSSAATEIESPEEASAAIADTTSNTGDSPAEPLADKPQNDSVKQQLDLMSVEAGDHESDALAHTIAHIDSPEAEHSLANPSPDGASIDADSSDIQNTDTDTDNSERELPENDNYAQSITGTHSSDIDDAVGKLNLDLSLDFDDDYTNSLADDTDSTREQPVTDATLGNPFADQSKPQELTGDMSEFSSTETAEAFEEYSAESPFSETETSNTDDSVEASTTSQALGDIESAVDAEKDDEMGSPIGNENNNTNNDEKMALEDLDAQYLADNVAQIEEALEHDLEELIHDLDAIDDEASADTSNDKSNNDLDTHHPVEDASQKTDSTDDSLALNDDLLADESLDGELEIDASHVNDELVNQAPKIIDEYQHDAFPDLDTNAQTESSLFASLSQDYETSNETESAGEAASNDLDGEDKLPPGVLPGQQSLFTGRARKPDSSGTYVRPERPTRATGENPFLPKHIRDRLHTNKALVDIIKETPLTPERAPRTIAEQVHEEIIEQLPPQLSAERVHHLVEDVIALYMPRIEAELRERLLVELRRIEPDEINAQEEVAEEPLPDNALSNEVLPDDVSSGDENH